MSTSKESEILLIDGGRLIDPDRHMDGPASILVESGLIRAIARSESDRHSLRSHVRVQSPHARILSAADLVVMPGLVDVHVHLREPGFEYKETVRTGCEAAARGGFVAVCSMANTKPVNDCRAVTEFILKRAEEAGSARVHPVGAVSRGLEGRELSEIGDMKAGGIVAISDDGKPVMDSGLMRRAFEYGRTFGLPVISHCEDETLCRQGVIHEGVMSTRLGLEGMPAEGEDVMVQRDIALAGMTGARLHIAHASTAGAAEAIRRAKRDGRSVTAEATPHHLLLTHAVFEGPGAYDTHFKMNPPLRAVEDSAALIQALRDGTIDCIATDHAPHSFDDKNVEFNLAPFGVVGVETAVGAILTLVHRGDLTLLQMAEKMSLNPSRIFGLPYGRIVEGQPANLTVIDPEKEWTVKPAEFRSKSRNTAFAGWTFKGDTLLTLSMGRWVYAAPWAPVPGDSRDERTVESSGPRWAATRP